MHNGHVSNEQLDQLSRQPVGSGGPWSHIEDCVQCRTTLEKYRKLNVKLDQLVANGIRSTSTMNCPDESVWTEVAAGTLSPEESLSHSSHAASCDTCAKKLQAAIRIVDPEVTEEEERVLDSLPQINRKRLATSEDQYIEGPNIVRLKKSNRNLEKTNKRSLRHLFSYGVPIAAVLIIGVFAFMMWHNVSETPDLDHLLTEAYAEYRPFQMRIPHARHAEMPQRRSGEKQSIARYSKSYRKANDEIDSELEKHPEDPKWVLAKAKLDLLDEDYKDALVTLERVPRTSPDDFNWLLLRALAFYEKGEHEGEPLAYGEAIDLYGKILQKDPDNTVALFNRALACQKILLPDCVIQDLTHLLKLEKDPDWSAEARELLDQQKKK